MPPKRRPTWCSKDLPQCLQNWLFSHQYSKVADVTVGEGVVERVVSRNIVIITLKDDSEVQIKFYKINHTNEPYYWEAKQALHQMLANQKVHFISLGEESPNTLLADVHLPSGHSATEMLISYGLASLQRYPKLPKKELKYLTEIENKARAAKRGIWSLDDRKPAPEKLHINEVLNKQTACMVYKIENVDSIQMMIIPDNFCINVTIPGSWSKQKTRKQNNITKKQFIARQKLIIRKHLLHKIVNVEFKSYDICANRFNGRIIHPQLAEFNSAFHKNNLNEQRSKFAAFVIEVFNGNSFTLRIKDRVIKNIFLSYIMFPWKCEDMKHLCHEKIQNLKLVSMYYTNKLRLDTREFLRLLLVGRRVQVTVDYLDGSKGIYCTMIVLKMNVAEVLIEKGYAYADTDHPACPYLAVENKAKECKVGMYGTSQQWYIDVAWCMDNVLQLLNILKKQRRAVVIVEQVLSPSYIILFSVELGWLFAFSLIDFEEVRRANTGISKRNWKEKVTMMIAEMCLQKEVSLQATSVDANGVLHGNLKLGNQNLRKLLLRKTEDRTSAYPQRHFNSVLEAKQKRIAKKHYKFVKSRYDAAAMQRIKQGFRRDVKSLASKPSSFLPTSPYFITNRKKKRRITLECHFQKRWGKPMIIKLDNMQPKKRVKRGKDRKKRRQRAVEEQSRNQQTEEKSIVNRKKRTRQLQQPKKNEQIKPNVTQTKAAAVGKQGNEVFKKKWKEVQKTVTLRWCYF